MPFNYPAAGSGVGADVVYPIARSIRFNSADSANFRRTPGAGGNRKKFTVSVWIRRTAFAPAITHGMFSATDGSSVWSDIAFNATDKLIVQHDPGGSIQQLTSTPVFRDAGAHQHIVLAFDTDNATAALRCRLYVNGVEQTWASGTLSAGLSLQFNASGLVHVLGSINAYTAPNGIQYFDGYFSELHWVDGLQLTADDFGTLNAKTGVWMSKPYGGAHGAQGYYLDFADNSNTTAATLGKDRAGANDWLPVNLNVAAGINNDSLVDTPASGKATLDTGIGGEMTGNYCVWNPLMQNLVVISDGGLKVISAAAIGAQLAVGTIAIDTAASTYFELTNTGGIGSGSAPHGGVFDARKQISELGAYLGNNANGWACGLGGNTYYNGSPSACPVFSTGETLAVAVRNAKLYFGKAAAGAVTWFDGGNPATETAPRYSGLPPQVYPAMGYSNSLGSQGFLLNAGQRAFVGRAPTGFKTLNAPNRAIETVALPATFAGNGAADGPFVWAGGVVETVTINGNVATRGTHFDRLSNGIKLRTALASYNTAGSNTVTAATYGAPIKTSRGQVNP